MEPTNLWAQLAHFIKESYTKRIKQSGSGVLMGFIGAQHLLFSGILANLVGPFWWVAKGIGTVVLAFFSSLATSYGAYLVDCYKEKKNPTQNPSKNHQKRNRA